MNAKNENKDVVEKEETGIIPFDDQMLQDFMGYGLKGIDMSEVPPAQLLLMQNSSTRDAFVDNDGNVPEVGQFFFNGNLTIFDEAEVYVISAKKSKYIDKRTGEEKDERLVVGLIEEQILFGMRLRGSAINSLNTLITTTVSRKKPMCVFEIHLESKQLSNDKGTWYVPVFRVGKQIDDMRKINDHIQLASMFDERGVVLSQDGEDDEPFTNANGEKSPF